MGRLYTSAFEALADKSCCNIQLPFSLPAIPSLPTPILQLPDLPSLPSISFYCPCQDADEQKLE